MLPSFHVSGPFLPEVFFHVCVGNMTYREEKASMLGANLKAPWSVLEYQWATWGRVGARVGVGVVMVLKDLICDISMYKK